jgi:hypothetical protein
MENAGGTLAGSVNTCNFPTSSTPTIFVRFPEMVVANALRLRFDVATLAVTGQTVITARWSSSIDDGGG